MSPPHQRTHPQHVAPNQDHDPALAPPSTTQPQRHHSLPQPHPPNPHHHRMPRLARSPQRARKRTILGRTRPRHHRPPIRLRPHPRNHHTTPDRPHLRRSMVPKPSPLGTSNPSPKHQRLDPTTRPPRQPTPRHTRRPRPSQSHPHRRPNRHRHQRCTPRRTTRTRPLPNPPTRPRLTPKNGNLRGSGTGQP